MAKMNKIRTRIDQAIQILKELGMPQPQLNDRTGLCLLALLNLPPTGKFSEAKNNLIGITPIMDFCRDNYETTYAPNSRETFRRFSMHQMVQAGIAVINPDKPDRKTNSPNTVYQISPDVFDLSKKAFTKEWKNSLSEYLVSHPALAATYSQQRELLKIPITIGNKVIKLSAGSHNILIKSIIKEFAPRFLHNSELVYVGDTSDKSAYLNMELIKQVNIPFDKHGKMPDVILYLPKENWVVIAESVTSHGPMDSKRYQELMLLFKDVRAEIVYLTAFQNRSSFAKYASEIAWETEVWISDNPDHLIHFDGTKFLGPYAKQ